jgi:hypothetical protein
MSARRTETARVSKRTLAASETNVRLAHARGSESRRDVGGVQ